MVNPGLVASIVQHLVGKLLQRDTATDLKLRDVDLNARDVHGHDLLPLELVHSVGDRDLDQQVKGARARGRRPANDIRHHVTQALLKFNCAQLQKA
jgi:hypothetical protein